MKTETLFSKNSDEWQTPWNLFDDLDREFHFDLDACATHENNMCPEYFTKEQDGLEQKRYWMSKEIEQDGFITREQDLQKSEPRFPKSMVLIKDMQMPFSCDSCRLKDRHYGECRVTWKKVSSYEEYKPRWCPLTEVVQYGPEGTLYKEK